MKIEYSAIVGELTSTNAERDVLREFVEAIADGRCHYWDKEHGVESLPWSASAKQCLREADEARRSAKP